VSQPARRVRDYLFLSVKGAAMGAVDVVPGVSGGTVAFVTGIYEELIESISAIGPGLWRVLRRDGPAAAWQQINGNFLLAVGLGLALSLLSFAHLIVHLLDRHPLPMWGLFFGLIVGSIWVVFSHLKQWQRGHWALLLIGTLVAFFVTSLTPAETPDALWFVGLSGMIAITAMILPGISGSFILLLLGQYATILGAVTEMDLVVLGTFAAGAVLGLMVFTRLLKSLFRRFHDATVVTLCGFMIGSLNALWPWQIEREVWIRPDGEVKVLATEKVLPSTYALETGGDAQLVLVLTLLVSGLAAVLLLHWIAERGQRAEGDRG
jgi:putative membrane protein